jgi:hypothetical protein
MKRIPRLLAGYGWILTLAWSAGAGHAQTLADLGNPVLAAAGLVDATAAPFFADPTGQQDSSDAINRALEFGRENGLITYLPAGDYRVTTTIRVAGRDRSVMDGDMNRWFGGLQGDPHVAGRRTRIILADNAPGFAARNPVPIVVHAYFPTGSGYNYTGHFNQIVRNLDIVIGAGNSGAVGLRMQGAEGCLIDDVTIDARHGWKGVWGVPGSGGSTHRLTVLGGEIGIDLRGYSDNGAIGGVGTQPGATLSQVRLIDQTDTPMPIRTRGSVTLVGAEIRSAVARSVFTLQSLSTDNPWSCSLSVIDSVIELSGATNRQLVGQLAVGTVPGRGYTLHNVFIKGIPQLDSVSGVTVATSGGQWTRVRELAVAAPLFAYQGNALAERIVVDGVVSTASLLFDYEANRAPDVDYVAYHGYNQVLPMATMPGALNIVEFGADPTGVADSTAAIRAAIAAGRDVFVPKGIFMVSDTLELGAETRLFGVHPHLSRIRARDTLSSGRRFGGLQAGDQPLPLVRTVDDPHARTVVSMVGIEAPRSAAQHRRNPVLVYALEWRAGRQSIIHHASFSPYNAFPWRLQNVMGTDFRLAQERGNYVSGGLEFSSNDILGRMIIEDTDIEPRISLPSNPAGSELLIRRADGQPFTVSRIDLFKATFEEGIELPVTITGTRSNGSTVSETVSFGPAWLDRAAVHTVAPAWDNLTRVVIRAALPFGVSRVESSQGITNFEKLRPFTVSVDCGDMRRGLEHFPFATIRHPQVVIRGNGGGRWYNSFHHGDIWANGDFRFIRIEDNRQPLHIYHWHLQHVHSDAQAVFAGARFVTVYGIKSEHNSRFLEVLDSDHIRIFGWAGLADAEPGSSHLYVRDTPNWLHAALAEEPHWIAGTEVWSTCDNPLIVHHVRLFDGIQESFGGQPLADASYERTILNRRGQPLAESTVDNYRDWTTVEGLSGAAAEPEAVVDPSGLTNAERYLFARDLRPALAGQSVIAPSPVDGALRLAVERPVHRPDAVVRIRTAAALAELAAAPWTVLESAGDARMILPQATAATTDPVFVQLHAEVGVQTTPNL